MRYGLFLRRILLIFTCLSASWSAQAQILEFEQNPPHLSWRQIQSDRFQLIYPAEFEDEAQKLAGQLQTMILRASHSLQKEPRKISIILQNQTVQSNGFVQLAPRRTEFFTVAPPAGEMHDWMQHLAIHELRHVVQFDKLVGGFRAPLWEQLGLAMYGLMLPSWFFEGDAVLIETLLTEGGRGRMPSWDMKWRTNLLHGKTFSYEKDYLGSMKDVTPGYYELGYFMVTKMRRDASENLLDSLMREMAKNPFRFYSFNRSLKKITGLNTRAWHAATITALKGQWAADEDLRQPERYPALPTVKPDKPAEWLHPAGFAEDKIIALHQGAVSTPEIVVLDLAGQPIETLIRPGYQVAPHFSYANGLLVWDEIRRNARFGKQVFNVVNTYEIETGTYRQLTTATRLFSPSLSKDGRFIIAVEVSEDNQEAIILLESETGREIQRWKSPAGMHIQTPSFHHSSQKIVCVAISLKGAAILEVDLQNGRHSFLLDWQTQQLERPVYWEDDVFFKAHYDGLDNIYKWNSQTQRLQKITNARFGAFNPQVDLENNRLLFNNYQLGGFRISSIPLDEPLTDVGNHWGSALSFFEPLMTEELPPQDSLATDSEVWISRPYKEAANLFNFHSLSATAGDFSDLSNFEPGLYWLSDNLLNTMQTRVGISYDQDIRRSAYHASVTYQRFFPKFELGFRNRGMLSTTQERATEAEQIDDPQRTNLRWRENRMNISMHIPLVYYRRKVIYAAGASVATSYTQRYQLDQPQYAEQFIHHVRFPLAYQVYFNKNIRRSALDLAPRWGQNMSVVYRHFPWKNQVNGTYFGLRSTWYFPGIAKNHTTILRFNLQNTSGTYEQINDIPLVSGFDQLAPSLVYNTFLSSYQMPLAYPDWSAGGVMYIRRIRGGAFFDFQNIGREKAWKPRTYGLEVRADLNLFRYVLPVFDVGAKLIWTTDSDPSQKTLVSYSISYRY